MPRKHVFVSGRVQGVFFRDATRKEALAQGVAGWVRNLGDGRVEAVFEGPQAAVERMVAWCAAGPPMARVEGVDAREEPEEHLSGFEIRSTLR